MTLALNEQCFSSNCSPVQLIELGLKISIKLVIKMVQI